MTTNKTIFQNFVQDQSGAVATDWVVLCAGIVGLAIVTTAVVGSGLQDLTGEVQLSLGQTDVAAPVAAGG